MKTNDLGRGLKNDSGFASLREISVLNSEKAQDAMRIIDKAIQDVTSNRGELGAFQRNNLESNLNYLRIAHENAVSSESVIRIIKLLLSCNFYHDGILGMHSVLRFIKYN